MVIGLLGQKVYPWRNPWSPAKNCKHESQEFLPVILKRHSQPDKDFFILSDIPID